MLHGLIREEGCCLSTEQRQTDSRDCRVLGCVGAISMWYLDTVSPCWAKGSVNHTPERWAVSCVAQHCSWGGVGESYHSHHSSPLLLPSLDTCGCLWIAFWGHLRFSSLCNSSVPPTQEALANLKLCRLCSGTQHKREITYLKLRCPSSLKTLCSERASASKLLLTFATNVII